MIVEKVDLDLSGLEVTPVKRRIKTILAPSRVTATVSDQQEGDEPAITLPGIGNQQKPSDPPRSMRIDKPHRSLVNQQPQSREVKALKTFSFVPTLSEPQKTSLELKSSPGRDDSLDHSFNFVYQLPIKPLHGEDMIPEEALRRASPLKSRGLRAEPNSAAPSTAFRPSKSGYAYQLQAKKDQVQFINSVYRDSLDAASPSASATPLSPARFPATQARLSPRTSSPPQYLFEPTPESHSYAAPRNGKLNGKHDTAAATSAEIVGVGSALEGSHWSWGADESFADSRTVRTFAIAEGIDFQDSEPAFLGSRPISGADLVDLNDSRVQPFPNLTPLATPRLSSALKATSPQPIERKGIERMRRRSETHENKLWSPDQWQKHLGKARLQETNAKAANGVELLNCLQVSHVAVETEQAHDSHRPQRRPSVQHKLPIAVGAVRASDVSIPSPRKTMICVPSVQRTASSDPLGCAQSPEDSAPCCPQPQTTQTFHTEKGAYSVHFDQVLGQGAFSAIFSCLFVPIELGGRSHNVAVKLADAKNPLAHNTAARELLVLRQIASLIKSATAVNLDVTIEADANDRAGARFVTSLLDAFTHDNALYLVLPKYDGPNLRAYLDLAGLKRGVSFVVFLRIVQQLLSALVFLHEVGHIVHADVKTENIVWKHPVAIDSGMAHAVGDIALIDFGNAFFEKEAYGLNEKLAESAEAGALKNVGSAFGYLQSRAYRAPEVILEKHYGPCMDVWSAGCVFAELLTGHVLFIGESNVDQLLQIEQLLGRGRVKSPVTVLLETTEKLAELSLKELPAEGLNLDGRFTAVVDDALFEPSLSMDFERELHLSGTLAEVVTKSPEPAPPLPLSVEEGKEEEGLAFASFLKESDCQCIAGATASSSPVYPRLPRSASPSILDDDAVTRDLVQLLAEFLEQCMNVDHQVRWSARELLFHPLLLSLPTVHP